MKTMKKFLQVSFSLLLICLVAYGLYKTTVSIWAVFKAIDPTLAGGILAASATILVSVITIMLSKRQEHKVEIEAQLRQKKIPIYEKLIEFIFLITFAEKLGKNQPSEREMIQFFADTTKDLVVWGSKEMVKAFGDFRENLMSSVEGGEPTKVLATVEDLLFAIRKDLGHKHVGIKRGDILRLYINDLNDYFPKN